MVSPLYNHGQQYDAPPKEAHQGLWFNRFFDRYDPSFSKLSSDEEKRNWIELIIGHQDKVTGLLKDIVSRQILLLDHFEYQYHGFYQSEGRFATGLGNEHPVENGFTFHSTLGTPYLCGAAVKGLVRNYFEEWHDFSCEQERQKKLKLWFGTAHKGDVAEQTGAFVFFDALPLTYYFAVDVMTPHMGKWYSDGQDITSLQAAEKLPGDWHSPVPIPFLTVKDLILLFSFAIRPTLGQAEAILAQNDFQTMQTGLTNALCHLGAGAKTGTGYGRFIAARDSHLNDFNKYHDQRLNNLKRASLSEEDRILDDVQKLKQDEKALIQAFSVDLKKTKAKYLGENLELFIMFVKDECADIIDSWKDITKKQEKNKYKAYRNLTQVDLLSDDSTEE